MKDPGIEIQETKNVIPTNNFVIPAQAGIHKAKQEYLAKKNGFALFTAITNYFSSDSLDRTGNSGVTFFKYAGNGPETVQFFKGLPMKNSSFCQNRQI